MTGWHRWRWLLAVAVVAALIAVTGVKASAEEHEAERFVPVVRGVRPDADTVRALIADRAAAHGASEALMLRVANCESRFDAGATGDHGSSHGLFQLNDWPTGLIWHFYGLGYTDAYDAWQASDYVARVFAGEFAAYGVTRWRWSCR